MHLKRLELTGFKSFADRTQLDLSTGLNAVVGPNGSGKSNIADALRWVLGEQSAKQLRGGKMEDVIFSGTAHRRPLGYAEIVMHIDNSEGMLPIEFKEISVARRVYRSGESEYSINGEACRLKDIQMLFMDTGVGRDGYSIIGQGRIDEILSLRSEDRRMVFEEAAGIGKFKARRNEALTKLERERQNRTRVDDIIIDLEEQLVPLTAQAEEAQRYLTMRDKYKNIHVNIFLTEIEKIDTELAQMSRSLQDGTLQFEGGKRQLAEARLAGEGLKNRALQADLKYRQVSESLLEITTAIEKKDGDAKLLESKIQQLEAERVRLNTEIEKRDTALESKSAERGDEEARLANLQDELNKLNDQLAEHVKLSAQLEDEMRSSAAAMDAHNQAIVDAMTAVASGRANLADWESAYLRLEDDKERLNSEILHHDTKLEEQRQNVQEAEKAYETCKQELGRAKNNAAAYASTYAHLSKENSDLENEMRKVQESLTVARGRHRAISDLEAQQEGFQHSVKAVLRKKAADPLFSGICGAVSSLIDVAREYEVALETALGGAAQNIVTRTESDAKLAINMLKDTRSGRATFLPLTAVKGKALKAADFADVPGFVDIASNLVTCDKEYEKVIAHLLGDVLIMDDIDSAMAFNKKTKYTHKIVTLGGERFRPGGAITGGGTGRQTSGIIGRGRQLEELSQKVQTLEQEFARLNEQTRNTNEKRRATDELLNLAREKEQALTLESERLNDRFLQANEALKNFNKLAATYNEENEKLMTALVETNRNIRDTKAELVDRENAVQKARDDLENFKQQLEQNRLEQTEESDTLTGLKIEISRRTEWVGEAQRTVDRLQREESVLLEEKHVLQSEISAGEKAKEDTLTRKESILAQQETQKARIQEIRNEQAAAEAEKAKLETAISKAEEDERAYADASSLMERELARLEMRKEQLDSASHRLHNEIWEEYGLTHQQALPFKQTEMSEAALHRTAQQLRAELATLTDINVGAIEAHKQLKTRYDFLTAQREDIIQAEAALDELINSLTAQMEEQFAAQFKLIAHHFEEVFQQMFSGGKASLKLVDDKNVLESGIEITAQPPGKTLQNMMLLSGGEKALTAIALLFAILRLKPSPFCVLDEIESALDDANVVRFAKYLKEYVAGTQFIVITHRKGTMEVADHLYGITMEEQGISKLVSVRFVDSVG